MFNLRFLDCEVKEEETSTRMPCIFPFEVYGISFNGCTNKFDEQNKTWCATKVDEDGHVNEPNLSGFWGYCSENCPVDLIGTQSNYFFFGSNHFKICWYLVCNDIKNIT